MNNRSRKKSQWSVKDPYRIFGMILAIAGLVLWYFTRLDPGNGHDLESQWFSADIPAFVIVVGLFLTALPVLVDAYDIWKNKQ